MTDRRSIESAFPLKQTSLDSVHEKNVRHGHISTLHIWLARRPLAACRAALLATLLPDPETAAERRALCETIGGTVRQVVRKTKDGEALAEETVGGILHWKREQENVAVLAQFRQRIRAAFGGRAPKVLDPFAGGGAIPLEAMRLGCEVTAADLNPVAWFILKPVGWGDAGTPTSFPTMKCWGSFLTPTYELRTLRTHSGKCSIPAASDKLRSSI